MGNQLKALLFCIMLSFCVTSQVQANPFDNVSDETLTWHIFEAPPLMITQGPHKGKGIVDGVRVLIQSRMQDKQHRELALPYKRFLLYAKQGFNICTGYLFKTAERETFLHFSNPAVIFPGFGAIMHKDTHASLGAPEEVSITELFKKYAFRLGTNKIRAYGPKMDPIIKTYEGKGQVDRHSGSTTKVFRLLNAKRVDFMIDFPNRILFWADELKVEANNYVSVPIKEEKKNAISYIACPKTDWGKKIIHQTNEILHDAIAEKEYLAILQRWSPANHRAEISNLHKRLLIDTPSPSPEEKN